MISMSNDVDIFSIWIYHYCSTCILYESIPLYIITAYVTIQYTSEHCSFSFTYSDIIWLTNHCSSYSRLKHLCIHKLYTIIYMGSMIIEIQTSSQSHIADLYLSKQFMHKTFTVIKKQQNFFFPIYIRTI